MRISRKAYVARTAHDQTHGNKLVAPEYGVIELRLKKGDSKKSKSILPESSTPRRKPTDGGEDDFCFAPGTQWKEDTWTEDTAKHDKVAIWYHLYNPFSVITEAKLELFRRFDKKAFWERELKDDELIDGEHELEFEYGPSKTKEKLWDGSLGKENDDFPDGFVTTEHSPYKLRLTVKGQGICKSPVAWTYFHILIEKLELEWGDKEAIPSTEVEKRLPFKELKDGWAKPTDGSDGTPARIYLVSNLFKTSAGEMFDNTLYTEYETLWGDGPEIPVYAKIWVRDSGGAKVVAPKALGGTKFLWDWESKLVAPTNTFVTKAQDYLKDKTKPKGQNCHKDRGGKRGDDTKLIFPEQAGYDAADTLTDGSFPFEVKKTDDPRKWASYSKAWRKGKLASKTGVLFQPSRMAGDKYKITVYAAHELKDSTKKLRVNVDKDAPIPIDAKLKVESGIWQVWRKLYFRRYMTKASGTATQDLAGMKAFFTPAFVEIEDKRTTAVETYNATDWNSRMTTIRNGWASGDQRAMSPTTNQHAAGTHGLQFRTRAQFRTALKADFSMTDTAVDNWLTTNNYDTDEKYAKLCERLALDALISMFNHQLPAEEGIALFQVEYSIQSSLLAALSSFTDGQAADFAAGGRNKCAFLWTAPIAQYSGSAQGVAATPAHEIGHHLFLPHPRNTAENTGATANNDYNAHDRAVSNCLMSYLDAARELCGFCQLRQRGWDKSKLKPDGTNSKA
jgi:hypothetical protein